MAGQPFSSGSAGQLHIPVHACLCLAMVSVWHYSALLRKYDGLKYNDRPG